MIATYRDPRYAASVRLEQLRERLGDLVGEIPEEIVTIHARRTARTWAGAAAIVGFAATGVSAIQLADLRHDEEIAVHPTSVLVLAVLVTFAVYLAARTVAALTFRAGIERSFDASGDDLARLARMEATSIRREAAERIARAERSSLWLPMAGIGLLAPLSMHLVIWGLTNFGHLWSRQWLEGFDVWIAITFVAVGLAHLTLAYMGYRFASKVNDLPLSILEHKNPVSGWRAYGYAVLFSTIPGLLLFAIPVVIVAVTGIVFVPYLFGSMHRRAVAERRALADL